MSETKRKDKGTGDKNKKNNRLQHGAKDPEAMQPKPDVHEDKKPPDSFEGDLKRSS